MLNFNNDAAKFPLEYAVLSSTDWSEFLWLLTEDDVDDAIALSVLITRYVVTNQVLEFILRHPPAFG